MLRKIGLSSRARPRERLVAPGIPVHRVVGVLEQVGTGGVDQAIELGATIGRQGGDGRGVGKGLAHGGLVSAVRRGGRGETEQQEQGAGPHGANNGQPGESRK